MTIFKQTAYFVLHKGMKHGGKSLSKCYIYDWFAVVISWIRRLTKTYPPLPVRFIEPLLCSHAECQNRGIRFLYCSACDGPVAQGNFSTRHAHPEVRKFKARGEENDGHSSSATNGSVIDSTTTDSSSNDDAVSTTSSNSTSEGDSGTSSSSAEAVRRGRNNNNRGEPHVVPPQLPQDGAAKVSSSSGGDSLDNGSNSDPNSSENSASALSRNSSDHKANKRKSMWVDLLNKRPRNGTDGDEMSAWLMAVFAVSDPDRMPTDDVLRSVNADPGGGTGNGNVTNNTTSSLSEDSNKVDSTATEDANKSCSAGSSGSLSSSNPNSADDGSGNDGSSNEDGDASMAEVERQDEKKPNPSAPSNNGVTSTKSEEVDTRTMEKHDNGSSGSNDDTTNKPSLSFNGSDTSSELYPTSSRTNENSNTESSMDDSSSDHSNVGRSQANSS